MLNIFVLYAGSRLLFTLCEAIRALIRVAQPTYTLSTWYLRMRVICRQAAEEVWQGQTVIHLAICDCIFYVVMMTIAQGI